MTAKKILHMHFGKEGGAERFFVNLVQAFAERGLEQRFVIRPGRIWRAEVSAIGPVIENHYRRLSLSALLLTWRVHRLIRQWRPDVIMSWMSRSSRLIPNDPAVVSFQARPRDVRLTIDADLQLRVAAIVADYARKADGRAAAVVLDPDTGAVLASASYPWPTASDLAPTAGTDAGE